MRTRFTFVSFGCVLALFLAAAPADAQFLGHNYTGDMGLMAGTQAAPGWSLAAVYLRYDGETLRDRLEVILFVDREALHVPRGTRGIDLAEIPPTDGADDEDRDDRDCDQQFNERETVDFLHTHLGQPCLLSATMTSCV